MRPEARGAEVAWDRGLRLNWCRVERIMELRCSPLLLDNKGSNTALVLDPRVRTVMLPSTRYLIVISVLACSKARAPTWHAAKSVRVWC